MNRFERVINSIYDESVGTLQFDSPLIAHNLMLHNRKTIITQNVHRKCYNYI